MHAENWLFHTGMSRSGSTHCRNALHAG